MAAAPLDRNGSPGSQHRHSDHFHGDERGGAERRAPENVAPDWPEASGRSPALSRQLACLKTCTLRSLRRGWGAATPMLTKLLGPLGKGQGWGFWPVSENSGTRRTPEWGPTHPPTHRKPGGNHCCHFAFAGEGCLSPLRARDV